VINNNFFSKKNVQEKKIEKELSKRFNDVYFKIKKDIENTTNTLHILNNKFKFNFKFKDLRKFKRFKTVAIIGMGGSILGAEAIYNFLEKKVKKKFYFFNNLDSIKIINFKKKEEVSKTLFIIISKSGNTIETLSNTFALNILKKNSKNIIVISEKKKNILFNLSKKLNLFHIEHKNYIGGRFSVLSEVGVVPAFFMGINISKFRSKILNCIKKNRKDILKLNTLKLAAFMKSKKFNNLIFLNYEPKFEKFLFWCQQLIAESLGKKNIGFLPMISIAPKDHHSLLQLYLDGPKDKLFNIFSHEESSKIKINFNNKIDNNFLNKKNFSKVKRAQKNALIKAFLKKNIPLREFQLRKINEEALGELFAYFIIETVIIAKILNINPFDQPAVEEVKIYTKQLLK
tara:strand:+ start:5358 stop:6560 length:1203 start_codon:yes stop_codon:yes gene_type:complete